MVDDDVGGGGMGKDVGDPHAEDAVRCGWGDVDREPGVPDSIARPASSVMAMHYDDKRLLNIYLLLTKGSWFGVCGRYLGVPNSPSAGKTK